jgi:hypothetical protein
MPLIVDDKSKDAVLDEIMVKIVQAQKKYHDEWHWLGPKKRAELRETINKMSMNYNMLVVKRYNKSNQSMRRNLHVPGPMPEAEKLALLQLIEST